MTTLELLRLADGRPMTKTFLTGLLRLAASAKRWRDRRHTLARLSQLSDRQVRDAGFEPSEIYDALNGQHASLWQKPHIRPDIR